MHVLATGTSGETVPDIQATLRFTLVILMQQTSGIAVSKMNLLSQLEGSYGEPSDVSSHHRRTQYIRQSELRTHRPETVANRAIENLHRDDRSQQVLRKTACKNAEFKKCGGARSTGRNEKSRTARGSAGLSPSQRLVLPVLLAVSQGFEQSVRNPRFRDHISLETKTDVITNF